MIATAYTPPHLRSPEDAATIHAAELEVAERAQARKPHGIGDTPEDTQLVIAYCNWRMAGHQGSLADYARDWRRERGAADERRIAHAHATSTVHGNG
jgi:hypothetical protein